MGMPVTPEMVEAAVWGGALLGGGGGGSPDWGLALGAAALARGRPVLAGPDEVPGDSTVVTVSLVGSPASRGAHVAPEHFCRAVELLATNAGIDIAAVVSNENGGLATVNGWIQSAVLKIPVLDVPCNGRAHPTALMGSLNLHRVPGYRSWQAAAGGGPDPRAYVEVVVGGSLELSASTVRQTAVSAGGLVAVARNPVTLGHLVANGAPGAVTQAIDLGRAMLAARGDGESVAAAVCGCLDGNVAARGSVREVQLVSEGGFDRGHVVIEAASGEQILLTVWNEYITAESGGEVLARFPDLTCTLDAGTGFPVATSEVEPGREVLVIIVDRSRLMLSPAALDPELLAPIERATGRRLVG